MMEHPTGYGCAALSKGARADAVVGNEGFGLGEIGRDAWRGDAFAALDALGNG
jgi:hypothetical protein